MVRIIKLTFQAESPILVAGEKEGPYINQQLIKLPNGKTCYIIPSTSWKGVLRNIASKIAPTIDFKDKLANLASKLHANDHKATSKEIEGIKKAGRVARATLDLVEAEIEPGMTTDDINTMVHEFTIKNNATSAPLYYRGFPKSVCVSINEVICHGIPGERVIKEGDIVNVDVTPILNGYYADASKTFFVGKPGRDARKIVRVAKESLKRGMSMVKPGNTIGDIGWAIQRYAEGEGCSVVREFVGHGVGLDFHEPPQVPHYGRKGEGIVLVLCLGGYLAYSYFEQRHQRRSAVAALVREELDESMSRSWGRIVVLLAGGLTGVVVSSDWIVLSATNVAAHLGVPSVIIALAAVVVCSHVSWLQRNGLAVCGSNTSERLVKTQILALQTLGENQRNPLYFTGAFRSALMPQFTAPAVALLGPGPAAFLATQLAFAALLALAASGALPPAYGISVARGLTSPPYCYPPDEFEAKVAALFSGGAYLVAYVGHGKPRPAYRTAGS